MSGAAAVAIVASYLLGSIPAVYLAGKARGVDLRKHGSGNLGAHERHSRARHQDRPDRLRVRHGEGRGAGVLLPEVDPRGRAAVRRSHSSGFSAASRRSSATRGRFTSSSERAERVSRPRPACSSRSRRFKRCSRSSSSRWCVACQRLRVALGSLTGAVALPILLATTVGVRSPLFVVSTVIALFVFWTHRANIERLRNGEEHRFGKKRAGGTS